MSGPLYIRTEAFLEGAPLHGPKVIGLVTILLGLWENGGRVPLIWDPVALAEEVSRHHAGPKTKAAELTKMREALEHYFTFVDEGRFVPSPEHFAVNDPNLQPV